MSTVVNKIELTANYYRNTGNKRITRGMKCLKQKTMNKRTKTTHRHPRLTIKLISTYDKNGWLAITGLKLIVVKAYSPFTLFSSNATSNSSFLFSNFKFSCFKSNALYCSARTFSWVTLCSLWLVCLRPHTSFEILRAGSRTIGFTTSVTSSQNSSSSVSTLSTTPLTATLTGVSASTKKEGNNS